MTTTQSPSLTPPSASSATTPPTTAASATPTPTPASTPATSATPTTANPPGAWPVGSTPLPADRRSFKLWGDPHAVAGDGKKFDNEQVGTMTQLKSASGDLELQSTQEHPPGKPNVTVNTAAAVKLGNNLVSYDVTRHQLTVNKKTVTLKPGGSMDLPGGGTIKLDAKGKTYTITSAKDDVINLHITPGKMGVPHLNIDGTLGPTRMDNEVRGALGNFHAGNGNDFVGRNGTSYDAQYGSGSYKSMVGGSSYNQDTVNAFEKSWMVSGPNLLTQNQGQGTNDTQWQKDTSQIQASLNNSKLGLPASGGPSTDRAKIYMQQPNGWSCAPTSLTMALAAWGVRPANQATLNEMIQLTGDNPNTGLPGDASLLADAAKKVGMQARFSPDGSPGAVRAALKAGHGVVLNGSLAPGSGHFIYVGGLNPDGSFKIFDPYRPDVTTMNDSELNAFANTNSNPRGFAEIWK